MKTNEKYIQRCIQLAKNGLSTTYPNPMVGSVIVHQDRIIGEGWHQKAGQPHAEVNAIESVSNQDLLPESTLYVNLEPCSHFGKTPPCADLIIEKKIKKVVIGTIDPHSKVTGQGIQKLKEAGVEVEVGFLENECHELNKRFFCFHQKKRPFVILKWAETQDGLIAPITRTELQPVWISNIYARQLVHQWRSQETAILVGTQTALDDNPKLDVRDWTGNQPIRMVIDLKNKLPKTIHLFNSKIKTIVICESIPTYAIDNCFFEAVDLHKPLACQILLVAYQHGLQSLIVEGGSKTLQTFIDENLWDECRKFVGNTSFQNGTKAPIFNKIIHQRIQITDNELLIYTNND